MSRTLVAPHAAHAIASPSLASRVGIALKAWWAAYRRYRAEQRAIEHLRGMSDRELKDIGIVRAQIDFAVRADLARDRVNLGL
jgi:uncharacterized protein YjiS (DUF1127 family)